MKISTRNFLALSATILFAVGVMLTFFPQMMYHSLPGEVILRSDIRSAGTVLLLGAGCVGIAAAMGIQGLAALILSALLYLGYGLGRIVSAMLDGSMTPTLVTVTAVEWVMGAIAAYLAVREIRRNQSVLTVRASLNRPEMV
jgi:hypothetical protein